MRCQLLPIVPTQAGTQGQVTDIPRLGETGEVGRSVPVGLCRRGRKHSFSFVIEVAKGVDPKVQRIRRRVVLIFALRDVPEPLSLRGWSH